MTAWSFSAEQIQDEAFLCRFFGKELEPDNVSEISRGLSKEEYPKRGKADTNKMWLFWVLAIFIILIIAGFVMVVTGVIDVQLPKQNSYFQSSARTEVRDGTERVFST